MTETHEIDPNLDLVLERIVDLKPELIWKAWTDPKIVTKWFTPAPWKTIDCTIDLRPGGTFRTVMQSPEGQSFPNEGCFLEIVKEKKLVWTSAVLPGFRPVVKPENGAGGMLFTAMIFIEAHAKGAKYTAVVLHATVEDKKTHEAMGFHDGWGKAFDQLVDHMKSI